MAIEEFIDRAEQVVREIETYEASGAKDIPARDLLLAKQVLTNMMVRAKNGTLPPAEHRHAQLSHLIMDQWPLGHSLGNGISTVEREYILL